jgi:hypothetical protein
VVRIAAKPDYRERSHDVQFGFRDYECVAIAARKYLTQCVAGFG